MVGRIIYVQVIHAWKNIPVTSGDCSIQSAGPITSSVNLNLENMRCLFLPWQCQKGDLLNLTFIWALK